jgi:hypothetical protein
MWSLVHREEEAVSGMVCYRRKMGFYCSIQTLPLLRCQLSWLVSRIRFISERRSAQDLDPLDEFYRRETFAGGIQVVHAKELLSPVSRSRPTNFQRSQSC